MALNREQKRQLKKSGELGDDGAGNGDGPPVGGDEGEGGDATPPRRRRSAASGAAPVAKEQRTTIRQFVKEVRAELRKVAWPTRKETVNYSVIVLLTLVFMTTLIFGLDWIFSEVVLRLFNAK